MKLEKTGRLPNFTEMVRQIGLWLAFCLVGLPGWAQKITISGKAVDRISREALPFATVGIRGKSTSTITNLQGEFDFHIPAEFRNDILVISMLGYVNYESPVWSLITGASNMIELDRSTTLLDEVVFKDSLTGGDILNIALNRIDTNYPMKPFLLEGFYRDVKRVAGTNVSLLEAAVKIYDDDYAKPRNKLKLRERVKLIEVRRSLGYESRFTDFFDQRNLLEDLLLNNNIRYRQLIPEDGIFYKMNREPDSYFNGHAVYVVTHSKHFDLKIFIDKVDFSFILLEYDEKFATPTRNMESKRQNLVSRLAGVKKTIGFREVDGKLYLSYMSMTSKVNWYDLETDSLKFETELFQQLLINEVTPNARERIASTEKMRNYGLQYQDLPYNKEFWDNYNFIKDTPIDKKVLEDLEKVAPLNKQFEGKY